MVVSPQDAALARLRTIERILVPAGIAAGVGGAAYAYYRSSSIWLSIFVLAMVSQFVAGALPKILYHAHRIRRVLFALLLPVGGAAILYLTYNLWHMMWLSVILGLVGGLIISMLAGATLFSAVVGEDQVREKLVGDFLVRERLAADPAAVAMKERFSPSEWDEIRRLPEFIIVGMAALSGSSASSRAARAWADAVFDPVAYDDPLFRMILIEQRNSIERMAGTNDALQWASLALSQSTFDEHLKSASKEHYFSLGTSFDVSTGGSSPHAYDILQGELNKSEFRRFVASLFQLGLSVASAGGSPTQQQMDMLLRILPASSREDLLAMMGLTEKRA